APPRYGHTLVRFFFDFVHPESCTPPTGLRRCPAGYSVPARTDTAIPDVHPRVNWLSISGMWVLQTLSSDDCVSEYIAVAPDAGDIEAQKSTPPVQIPDVR